MPPEGDVVVDSDDSDEGDGEGEEMDSGRTVISASSRTDIIIESLSTRSGVDSSPSPTVASFRADKSRTAPLAFAMPRDMAHVPLGM